jgi:hypothetical protein
MEYFTDIIKVITDTDNYFDKDKSDKLNGLIYNYMKNGFYIPFIYIGLLLITQNLFHSTVIAIKLYPANHYYWFGHLYSYSNIPKQYNWVKQFVRMTDTGHLVSFLYLLDKSYLPLAHNVHFFITIGYWTGRVLGSHDQDSLIYQKDTSIIQWYDMTWSCISHGVPYILFLRELILSEQCFSFDLYTLWLSYRWNYIWLLAVYIPWRFYTGDVIYTILDIKNGIEKPLYFIIFLHVVTIISNIFGYLITIVNCT